MDERDAFEPLRTRGSTPHVPPVPTVLPTTPMRSGYGLGAVVGAALASLAVGVGIGYAAFHTSTKTTSTAGAASAPSSGTAASFTLGGTFTLQVGAFENDNPTCKGLDGYSDIAGGTPVVVADETGKTIAVGQLDTGVPQGSNPSVQASSCDFSFSVTVPDGRPFYSVTVSHRGTQTYSTAKAHLPIALTLG